MSLTPGSGSIRSRILGGFVVAGLLPLVGVLLICETLNNRALQRAEFKKIRELGGEAVRQITSVMDRAASALDAVASNPILLDPAQSPEAKIAEMTRLVRVDQSIQNLTLHDKAGFVMGSTTANHPRDRDRSRWLRDAVRSGRQSITSPHRVMDEEGLFLSVYIPLGEIDSINEVITARFRFEEIQSIVEGIRPGDAGELVLLDEFGNLLAGRDQERILTRFDTTRPVIHWLEENQGYYTANGVPCLFTSHPLGPQQTRVDRPWILICFEPIREVDAVLTDSRFSQLLAGACGLLLACGLGLFISRHLSKPLERAAETAQAINQGNFDVRVPLDGPQEIKRLAASFNKMIEDLIQFRDAMESKVDSRTRKLKSVQNTLKRERASLAKRVEMRTRELRAANKELARSARMKNEFLAGMSHELRTPLNAVLGLTESLAEGTYGDLNDRQRTKLQIIDDSGRHLLSLISDILDVAKVESGEMQLDFSQVDIAKLCESCTNLLSQTAQKKGLDLQSNIDPKAVSILADERRLKQILVNLLSNAVKFTSTGSVGLDITASEKDRTISFVVWDTGIGIPNDQIDRLFQPFVQLDSSLARQYDGTGLGLALVYNFTEIHGGSVSAESKPDQGTRITVTLPWRHAEEGVSETTEDVLPARTICLGKVLLADDNQTERFHLAESLNRHGYEVHLAQDGAAAVEKARAIEPDIILIDVQMPGMDGLEATHHLRGEPAFRDTPIVGLTALNTPADIRRIHEAGMTDCVLKPACLFKLVSILDFHIDNAHRKASRFDSAPALAS